jgi:formylglycine-generating enzyme
MTHTVQRRPHPYRPWLVAVACIAAGFTALVMVKPTRSRPAANSEEFIQPTEAPGLAPEGMVWIPGGPFWMGSEEDSEGNASLHRVAVSGFWMDKTEVTNAQFEAFVKATGYKTVAELPPSEADIDGREVPPEKLVPFSVCFVATRLPEGADPNHYPPTWWHRRDGADWRHPEGPDSHIRDRMNHPVVHIAWKDAVAYAKWAGKRLPTESEWEFAARGGLDRQEYCWGSEDQGAGGIYRANTYQGIFPEKDIAADGYAGTAPVGSFPPNGFGLYDMSGNVWEWCNDWYGAQYYWSSPKNNPPGPEQGDLARDSTTQRAKVRRGGSFLCADEYCRRYLPAARDHNPPNDGACHTGFRCVKDR